MSFFNQFRNPKFQQSATSTLFTLLFSLPFVVSASLNIQYLNEKIANNVQLKGVKNSKSLMQSALSFNTLFLVSVLVMMVLYMLYKFNVLQHRKDFVLISLFVSVLLGIISFGQTTNILLKDMDNREFSKESKTTQASYVMNIVSFVYLMLITLYHGYALACQRQGGKMESVDDTFYKSRKGSKYQQTLKESKSELDNKSMPVSLSNGFAPKKNDQNEVGDDNDNYNLGEGVEVNVDNFVNVNLDDEKDPLLGNVSQRRH